MVKLKLTIAAVFAVLFFNQVLLSQQELSAEKIFDIVNNSVVVILAYDNAGNIYQGSGVVVTNDGLIVTNYHVCKDAGRVEIKHYQNEYKTVETFYIDEQKDILILRVKNITLKGLKLADSTALKPGQRVYAVGSPEGYENSISEGIISGFRLDENNVKLIQMTTPITEGSSGGAVVNSYGELIGLSMSGQHEGSLYFALPVTEISGLVTDKKNAEVAENPAEYFEDGTKANDKANYKEAETYFTKYLDKFSSDIAAYYNRGYARFKLKDYKNAINDFSKVLDYNSKDDKTLFYRGNCYYYLKDYKNALSDYSKAIVINKTDADIFYNRGYANYKLNNLEAAVKDWEKAIELSPEYDKELNPKIKAVKQQIEDQE
jgi:hypothetical protein